MFEQIVDYFLGYGGVQYFDCMCVVEDMGVVFVIWSDFGGCKLLLYYVGQ